MTSLLDPFSPLKVLTRKMIAKENKRKMTQNLNEGYYMYRLLSQNNMFNLKHKYSRCKYLFEENYILKLIRL